ncbi:MAG: NifU family protein [Euryarchaeota archaeon]|nr:NifU family protein [Euryarchaeota archaeon]
MRDNIEAAIDEIRPALHMDGGDCEIVNVDEAGGVVSIRLVGACGGCAMSTLTLKQGIERILKERVPMVRQVETVVAF